MIVTINTDASWSPKHHVASYAFWIRSNNGKIAKSGMLKGKTYDADFAEYKCILNALHVVFNSGWQYIDKIIVNTDSMNSIHVFKENKSAIKKYRIGGWHNHYRFEFYLLKEKHKALKLDIEFRHVKAHVSTEQTRQWVNDWCDKEAKAQLINWHKKRQENETPIL